MEEILLTVSLPNYNHGHFLSTRIPSLLAAMPASSELLVVDDGSTDNSVEILEEFAVKDSRLKLVKNEKNKGVNYALNIILQKAKGKYISFMSADDSLVSTFFTKILAVAEQYPEAGVCCSDCGLSFEEGWPDKKPGEIYTTQLLKDETNIRFFSSSEIITTFQTTSFWIPGHASIVKTKSILEGGGFNPKLGPYSDWFLLHSIALKEGVAYLPETLAIWHQSGSAYSTGIQTNENKKKAFYHEFFIALAGRKNRKLRALFKKSTLLHFYGREIFRELVWKPQHWYLVLPIGFSALKRKTFRLLRRLMGFKTKPL